MKIPAFASIPVFSFLISSVMAEGEIGFIERFALAEDRSAATSELIPGTEDFYFFNALLAQQENRLADVDALLETWIKRHGSTPRVLEIQNRQALLRYSDDPQKTLAFLKDRLGLQFNHQQARRDARPNFPTTLDPARYSSEAFLREALKRKDLSDVSDAGLDYLLRAEVNLTDLQRRELLRRLAYPDYDRLVGLVAADLRTRESRIHIPPACRDTDCARRSVDRPASAGRQRRPKAPAPRPGTAEWADIATGRPKSISRLRKNMARF